MAKIKQSTIALIAVFIATFKAQGLPNAFQYSLQVIMLTVAVVYLVTNRRRIKFINISLIYSGAVVLSSVVAYFTKKIYITSMINGLYYAICLFCFYNIISNFIKNNRYYDLITILFRITVFYNVTSFISVIIHGTGNSQSVIYLWGGKFDTCYYFILMVSLFYVAHMKDVTKSLKWKLAFLSIVFISFLFCAYINCITVMMALLLMFIFSFFGPKIRMFFSKRMTVVIFILASGLVLFVLTRILSISFIENIITGVLGKSITLTSRTPIYERYLFPLIYGSPILGYGYGSSIMHQTTLVYWNAQNGIFEIMLNFGAVGLAAFLVTVFKALKGNNKYENGWGLYMLVYGFIIAATIEISYTSNIFIVTLYLIYLLPTKTPKLAEERRRKRV